MERYSSRKVDDLGRIVLHSELRNKLGLGTGAKVALTVVDSIVVMQRMDTGDCEVCELGMITLPVEVRHMFGWVAKSEIAVYQTDLLLIMKTA